MTLSELKREAKNGTVKFELIERYGETGEQIPERCRGVRTVAKVNTVAITLKTESEQTSELRYPAATLIDYDGETLTIYDPGTRELTQEEQNEFKKYHRELEQYKEKYPYSNPYWFGNGYKKNSPYPYLMDFDKHNGKRVKWEKPTENSDPEMIYRGFVPVIIDDAIKGNAILKYKIHR